MKTISTKKIILILFLSIIMASSLAFYSPAYAGDADMLWGSEKPEDQQVDLGERTPKDVFVSVINIFAGVLIVYNLVFILIGATKWKTAQGGDKLIEDAQHMIRDNAISLAIILIVVWLLTYLINKFFS